MLVASCPCALVLATPATAIAAIAVAARHGILIKGTGFLENMANVDAVVFDKTGTLTTGQLSLIGTEGTQDEAALLRVAAALGAASSHPVSRAATARVPPAARATVDDAREEGGFGVTGRLDGKVIAFGRPELFARLGVAVLPSPQHDGPVAGVSAGGEFLGWLLFADRPRPEAAGAVAELRGLGLTRQVLLTGDRAAVAAHVGAEVGIADICADALPDQKMRRVQAETRAGRLVLVVGDGINDSLAPQGPIVAALLHNLSTFLGLANAGRLLLFDETEGDVVAR